ncbi:MAG: hypothetical protein AB7L66_07135 [Gemmatimonadales bacterium]
MSIPYPPAAARAASIPFARRIGLVAWWLAFGCAASRPWDTAPLPVADTPEAFVPAGATPATGSEGCQTRLRDPRDGTSLTLIRSVARSPGIFWGDYEVEPPRRYGLTPGQLLRIDCRSGQAFGKVPRG